MNERKLLPSGEVLKEAYDRGDWQTIDHALVLAERAIRESREEVTTPRLEHEIIVPPHAPNLSHDPNLSTTATTSTLDHGYNNIRGKYRPTA